MIAPAPLPAIRDEAHGEHWTLLCGDSCEVLPTLPSKSIHLILFSPPFKNLYTYSPTERDLGNCRTSAEFFEHHAFISREALRALLPGRLMAVHCYDIQEYANSRDDGMRGRQDFPGELIRHFESVGFRWRGRITVNKNPQAAATRNHPQELLFETLRGDKKTGKGGDGAKLCVGQADYVLVFKAPGDNPVPVKPDIDEDTWVKWAHPVWTEENGTGIRETDVLLKRFKGDDDERHLCPLQLPLIERCIRLWTNPGETVLDPFSGIGSTASEAVRLGRRGIGIELNPAYHDVAVRFCRQAEQASKQRDLFSVLDEMQEGAINAAG
jgi:DNA modification methylase